jgi:hypothetical protein
MPNARWTRLRIPLGCASLLGMLLLADGHAPQPAAAEDSQPIGHELLTVQLERQSHRIHRFRIRVADVRADVADLGFQRPVADSLGPFALAINGGYWEWHRGSRRMIGLVISQGKQLSPLRKKLDGGLLVVEPSRARIVRSRGAQLGADVQVAVQCRPRLVEAGKPVPELNATARATRTAVCVRDRCATLDVLLTDPRQLGPSLAGLAGFLAADGCSDALNLDGGPSTAAGFRQPSGLLRVGLGLGLPYSIRFGPRSAQSR